MKPHELAPAPGAHRKRKRVGRGISAGGGKTAGRGTKGTKARSSVSAAFEGGQMPLVRRLPKLKGFKPPHETVYGVVNLDSLRELAPSEIGPAELRTAGLIKKRSELIKVLGRGDIDRSVSVRAHAFSESAVAKIEAAGGSVEVLHPSVEAKR
ncbi:MAG: 50S ribosomal protein L15 [Actinobacteria bacterium]|nr:50S ribosomal protein L15 [Actinomycetota bacterium]